MNRKHLLLATSLIAFGFAAPALADNAPATAATAAAVATDERGTITYNAAYFAQYNPNTASDMVNRIPGFSVDDGDSARGFEGNVGNILINGSRPASKADTGSAVLGRTPANRVERIELIRGGVPGIEMQGYAVVVNVILKTDASREHIVSLSNNVFDGGPNLWGGSYQYSERRGDRSFSVTYSDAISQTDSSGTGPSRRVTPDGTVLRDERFENYGYGGGHFLRGALNTPAFGGTLDLTARVGIDDWQMVSEYTAPTVYRRDENGNESDSFEFGGTYTRDLGANTRSETRLIHEQRDREASSSQDATLAGVISPQTLFVSDTKTSESILRSLIRHQRSPAFDIELGGEVAFNSLDTQQAYSIGGVAVPLTSADVTVEELRGELFGKTTWRINPQWTLETGLRLENSTISQSGDANQEKSFFFAKPRALVTWTPRQSTQLRLRIEQSVGQLDFGDFAASAELSDDTIYGGNANLEPEQRLISELTMEQRFWGDGVVSVGLRHDEISDTIDYLRLANGAVARGNIGDGTYDHLMLSVNVPMDRFGFKGGRLRFDNTWIRTEVTDPTTGEARRISGLRHSQPRFVVSQSIPSAKVQWQLAYLPRMAEISYHPERIQGWHGRDYFEASVEYQPRPDTSIRLQANYWDAFDVFRTEYADRAANTVAYYDTRLIDPRFFYQLRVRKTF